MMGAPSLPSPSTAAQNPVSDSALPSGKANPNSRTSSTTMSQMTDARFADQPLCSPTKRALAEVLRYETMTKVQQGAIPPALAGEVLSLLIVEIRLSSIRFDWNPPKAIDAKKTHETE